MKADFEGPPDGEDRESSTDGWFGLVTLIVAILVVVAIALFVLPRS